jgi:uncharacterized protein
MSKTSVRRNDDRNRYEIFVDGRLVGLTEYRQVGGSLVFPHTEIDPAMRGQGLGAELVRGALDDVRGSGLDVVPRCWFVAEFIERHPEYGDLLAA